MNLQYLCRLARDLHDYSNPLQSRGTTSFGRPNRAVLLARMALTATARCLLDMKMTLTGTARFLFATKI
jgi:hypothetical protein